MKARFPLVEPDAYRILVVDDEPFIRSLIQATVEGMGHAVCVAEDGLAALEVLQEGGVDLVLTDLLMPRMSGLELVREVRNRFPEVPVVIVTGYASLETALAAMHEGVYDYLTKPFQIDELRLTVRNALERIAILRENRRLLAELADALRRLDGADPAACPRGVESGSEIDAGRRAVEQGLIRLRALQDRLLPFQYAPSVGSGGNAVEALSALDGLRNQGTITAPEFQDLKRRILEGR